jgi:hypothetical protein
MVMSQDYSVRAAAVGCGMPRPDLVIRVVIRNIVGGGGPVWARVVTLVVEVGALVETETCLAPCWEISAWVARELERLRTGGVLRDYVVRSAGARGDMIGVVRKGCLTSYVLDLSGTTERWLSEPRTFELARSPAMPPM